MLIFWVVFMFPIDFQAVLGLGPEDSGLWLMPLVFTFPVRTSLSGAVITKLDRHRPLHLIGFVLWMVGYSLCSILDRNSPKVLWAIFQIILAFSIALPITTLLPAMQAPLVEEDTAASTGAWALLRSYGTIFGAAIPADIFNDRFNQLLGTITDASARSLLSNGGAYAQASLSFSLDRFSNEVHDQVNNLGNHGCLQHVFATSLANRYGFLRGLILVSIS